MRKVKRMVCLVLSIALALCAAGTAVFAVPASEAEISGVKFLSDGVEVRKFPAAGAPVSAEVITNADALALIIAAYDADEMLVDTAINTSGTTVGPIVMTEKIAKIRLLAWENMEQMIPVSGQVYTLTDTDPDNPGALQEFIVNGVPAVMEGGVITAFVPVWNAQGDANTTWTVKGVTKAGTGTITVGTVSMQAGEEKTMALEPTLITVTEDGKTAAYQLNLRYTITEDFDTGTVFDNSYLMTGSETAVNAWEQPSIVKGNLAQNTFKFSIINTKEETMAEYQPKLRAGVKSISEATKTDGTNPMDTADTKAAGKALMVGKTASIDNSTDCGNPIFKIENKELFQNTDLPITVEYDLAVDYSKATAGIIGLNGAGVRYNGQEAYSIYDAYAATSIPGEDQAVLQLRTNDGTTTANVSTGAKINRWHHIKQVFDKKTNTATTYVDGTAFLSDYNLANAEGYQDALNLCFQTSSRRAADIWLDNIQVTWGRNYIPQLKTMTVAGQPAVIDSANELITVNLPLWDAAGEAVDASDVAVVLNGTGNVTVGETVVANDSSTRMDLTQAKRVTVGTGETQRTYDMVINRTIFDDFDEHTVFSGEVKGSATVQNAWEDGQTMISGAKASSIMKLDLINGLASDATYQPKVSAAVAPISTAKGLDGTTTIAVSSSSGAAGNALRLRKLKSLKGTNTGTALLKIAGDDFKDAKNAITIEYDMAFDYSNAEGDQWGLLGAGARYNHQNEAAVTDSAVNLLNKPDADSKIYPRIYYGSNITDQPAGNAYTTLMDCQTNAWMHVKIVIDVPNREAKTTVTLLNTATGKEVSKTASSGKLDGGTGDNSSDQDGTRPYKRATWNDQLNYTFATSSQRCADLWVDNLSIAYDVSSTQ